MSWNDLTVVELRNVLSDYCLEHLINNKTKKKKLVDYCNQYLNESVLAKVLTASQRNPKYDLRKRKSEAHPKEFDTNPNESSYNKQSSQGLFIQPATASRCKLPKKHYRRSINRSSSEIKTPSTDSIYGKHCFRAQSIPKSLTDVKKEAINSDSEKIVQAGRFSTLSQDISLSNLLKANELIKDDASTITSNFGNQNMVSPYLFSRKQRKKKVLISWKRILIAILASILLGFTSTKFLAPIDFFGFFDRKPFCSTGLEFQRKDCIICPNNAVCDGYQIRCADARYNLVKIERKWVCLINKQSYIRAEMALKDIAYNLSFIYGTYLCFGNIPKHGIKFKLFNEFAEKTYVGLDQNGIKTYLSERNYKTSDIDTVLTDLLHRDYLRKLHKIEFTILKQSNEDNAEKFIKVYYSEFKRLPIKCRILNGLEMYLWYILLLIALSAYISLKLWLMRQNFLVMSILKQVITENTTIQQTEDGRQYAHGPTAYIIHQMMNPVNRHLNNSNYSDIYRALSLHKVEKYCSILSRSDPSICKSHFAYDHKPYYYNKLIVDTLFLQTSDKNIK